MCIRDRYGSVVTSAFEIASTDGMNEKGLVANLLWLPETEYPVRDQTKPGLAITAWVQYMLCLLYTSYQFIMSPSHILFRVIIQQRGIYSNQLLRMSIFQMIRIFHQCFQLIIPD